MNYTEHWFDQVQSAISLETSHILGLLACLDTVFDELDGTPLDLSHYIRQGFSLRLALRDRAESIRRLLEEGAGEARQACTQSHVATAAENETPTTSQTLDRDLLNAVMNQSMILHRLLYSDSGKYEAQLAFKNLDAALARLNNAACGNDPDAPGD